MEISRAQEILNAEKTIDVKLNGVPVWIDKVDSSSDSVTVHVMNQPSNQKIVSVDELREV